MLEKAAIHIVALISEADPTSLIKQDGIPLLCGDPHGPSHILTMGLTNRSECCFDPFPVTGSMEGYPNLPCRALPTNVPPFLEVVGPVAYVHKSAHTSGLQLVRLI